MVVQVRANRVRLDLFIQAIIGLSVPLDLQEALERNLELVLIVISITLGIGASLEALVVDSLGVRATDGLETLAEINIIISDVDRPVGDVRVQPHGGLGQVIPLEAVRYLVVSLFGQFRVHPVLVAGVIRFIREVVFSALVVGV